jgi:anthranilate/para-aminobenzoate synthase component I/anthranilate/para-aminobenzoate synthase component II
VSASRAFDWQKALRVSGVRLLFVENDDSFSRNVISLLPVTPRVASATGAAAHLDWAEALVLGPGPGTPEKLIPLVHGAAHRRLPTLGICLGHQAIGMAFGAKLERVQPTHGKVSRVDWAPHPLLPGIVSGPLDVMRYHSLGFSEVAAPLQTIATTSDGVVMAVAHQALPMVGFQFHPDSYATPKGQSLVAAFFGSTHDRPTQVPPARSTATANAQVEPVELEKLRPPFALLAPGFTGSASWLLLEGFHRSDSGETGLWLAESETDGLRARRWSAQRVRAVQPDLSQPTDSLPTLFDTSEAAKAIAAIRASIAAGDVYQVNYTLRAEVEASHGATLLRRLCRSGTPRFAAWVNLGNEEHVSASPEQLFRVESDGWVHCEPMKGTAAPSAETALMASEKDAAELAMIVDLTRDDLHHLCVPGSVQVANARRVVRLPYVIQTVADVCGLLRPGVAVRELLATFHPGGSVTGAPRAAAVAAIGRLETSARGLYCGSIGLEQNSAACFSVAIRTATRVAANHWVYGVGAGITWGSDAEAEMAEIRLKLGAL